MNRSMRAVIAVAASFTLIGATPPVLDRFPNAFSYVVPDTVHPALSAGECIAEFVAEFIETMAAPAGQPCPDG